MHFGYTEISDVFLPSAKAPHIHTFELVIVITKEPRQFF